MILKKKIVLLILFQLFIGINENYGQSSPLSSGGDGFGAGGSISYSVGQIDYTNFDEGGYFISEGVQQPFEFFNLGFNSNEQLLFEVFVYPNPTQEKFTIKVSETAWDNLSYQLIDLTGKQLKRGQIVLGETEINMSDVAASSYLLLLYSESKPLKSLKIIKN